LWQENEQSTKDYLREILKKCDSYEMTCALAVDLETDLVVAKSLLKEFAGELNYLQVMGIKTIGKQGEHFDEEVLTIIKDMKEFFTADNIDLPIFVDGGMNEESIRKCKEAGAEVFVVGSALARAGDYKSEFEYLNNL
jgi:ribulose-phosphate 3-epimerase